MHYCSWSYVKTNQLQDPENGRRILADSEMQSVFGVKTIEFQQVSAHLKKHLEKIEQ